MPHVAAALQHCHSSIGLLCWSDPGCRFEDQSKAAEPTFGSQQMWLEEQQDCSSQSLSLCWRCHQMFSMTPAVVTSVSGMQHEFWSRCTGLSSPSLISSRLHLLANCEIQKHYQSTREVHASSTPEFHDVLGQTQSLLWCIQSSSSKPSWSWQGQQG